MVGADGWALPAAWYSTFLNSLVHVVMYTYYFIAALLGSNEKAKKRYLWWGRYLTQFQMFQFVTMLSQVCAHRPLLLTLSPSV